MDIFSKSENDLLPTAYGLYLDPMKPIIFHGSALADLKGFPDGPRREAGRQLDKVQRGQDPADWKPMTTVGPGIREIRIHDASGAFRVMYVAKFADGVHVLHCFEKKSQKTAQADIDIAARRFRALTRGSP